MAAPRFRKRLTLFEEINRLVVEGDDFRLKLMEELTAEQENLINFRPYSDSTQSAQDRMLRLYKNFVQIGLKRFEDGDPDDVVVKMCFPDDHKVLFAQLEFFMLYVAMTNKGRSLKSAKMSYRAYTKYRAGLIFWCDWHYNHRDLPLVQKSKLFNKLTTAMQAGAAKYKLKSYGILNRTHVGLAELRQMIDYDMAMTQCIELAECHHLAWCIGRVAAVRPGSIGPSRTGKGSSRKVSGLYLKWSDVVLTRGEEKGMFDVEITFRALKTNHERNYEAADKAGRQELPLKAIIKAPRRLDNIIFSVPLRLLVIALRRKALVGITTVDELLNGQTHYLTIAPEFLDKPIVLASVPRGLNVKPDEPAMSGDLTDYLQLRGKKLGYDTAITFYSIRRRSATDMTRVFGADKARLLMGHDADSRVLESYYMDYTSETPLSAALLNEPVREETARLAASNAPLAIHKLPAETVKRLHGTALNALVRKMVIADEYGPQKSSGAEYKNYLRMVSRVAYDILLSQEVQKQRERLTKTQLDEKVKALEQSNIMDQILARAAERLKAARLKSDSVQKDVVNDPLSPVLDDNNMFQETGEAHEEDLGRLAPSTVMHTRETDEPDADPGHEGSNGQEVTYPDAVQAFMEVVLENSMNQSVDLKNDPQRCVLCAEDETVPDSQKQYQYSRHDTLKEHMNGLYHTPKVRFGRWIELDRRIRGTDSDDYTCPYCPDNDKALTFPRLNKLFSHIENSTAANSSLEHDNQKRADGWYDLDWAEVVGETVNKSRKRKRQEVDRRSFQSRTGLTYSDLKALPKAITHPFNKDIMLGGPAPKLSTKLTKQLEFCDSNDILPVAEHIRKYVEVGELPEQQTQPQPFPEWASKYIERENTMR